MKINPHHLVSSRDEYSLLAYGRRCFGIIWGPGLDFLKIHQFVEEINSSNPHRVFLHVLELYQGHTPHAFIVIEMEYRTAIQQKYFTYLMAVLSLKLPFWIHIWDTLEHDAFRRDFLTPSQLDSELCINRLWLKNGAVFLIKTGFTEDNPHGEFVPEVTLDEAMEILEKNQASEIGSLTQEVNKLLSESQPHMMEHVLDITNVYIPKKLANLVLENPHWIEFPDFDDFDPTQVNFGAIPDSALLADEIPFTVAISDINDDKNGLERHFSRSLTTAQWVSLAIKNNANNAFLAAKDNIRESERLALFLGKSVSSDAFSSETLINKLVSVGLANTTFRAKLVKCPDLQLKKHWKEHVCVLDDEYLQMYKESRRQEWKGDGNDFFENNDYDIAYEPEAKTKPAVFAGLEDTSEFAENFTQKDIWGKLSAVIEDPQIMNQAQAQALSETDLEKTADLEDFDDFVEYYARHFLGYDEKDLEKHRVEKSPKQSPGLSGKNGDHSFDWQKYNDDSDYDSAFSEEEIDI